MLAKSLETVNRSTSQQVSKSNKEAGEIKEMHAKAPEAIAKYISTGCDASKLTIPELEAVARVELATTLKGKDKGEKAAMFKSKVAEMSWDPRAGAAASAWKQWDGRAVKRGGKAGVVAGRGKDQQSVTVRGATFEALAELMAAADAIPRDSSRRRN